MPEPIARVADRRIYVTRGASANNRAVTNEAEVRRRLSARGFRFVDPGRMTVAEQIRTFAEASVVVATHGAALVNLVFASPGATVVELFPNGCIVDDYWKLANGVPGLTYRYQLGLGPGRPGSRSQMLVRDIMVDVDELERTLDIVERRSDGNDL
jgi:capsular polysaccharide biosynthesis protein